MATGTVGWFSDAKGYGFIRPDDGGPDLFVHYSDLQPGIRELMVDAKVQYDVGTGTKGPQAKNVAPLG